MKLINISTPSFPNTFTMVDDADYEELNKYKWRPAKRSRCLYVVRSDHEDPKSNNILMHRAIMGSPKGMDIDHRDNNGLNNQRYNLRECTHQQNCMNRNQNKGKSKYMGVGPSADFPGMFRARIKSGDKQREIGRYPTEIEAAIARDAEAKRCFGEFAKLNFPDGVPV